MTQNIEKIKSVILVVLLLTTILLLYFFWEGGKISDFELNSFFDAKSEEDVMPAGDLTVPSRIEISFDNDTYSRIVVESGIYWNAMENNISDMFTDIISSGDAYAEEITAEQYAAVKKYEAVTAVFEYTLPFKEYCDFLGYTIPQSAEEIFAVSEICFSKGNLKSMFITDETTGRYYRFISELSSEALIDEALAYASVSANTSFYPLADYLGEETAKNILVPVYFEFDMSPLEITRDFSTAKQSAISDTAKSFFSGTFDFVRKIEEESGNVIYMYGYGEKTLIAGTDGTIEYKAEADRSVNAKTGYFKALELALETVAKQGGFSTAAGSIYEPYLAKVGIAGDDFDYSFEIGVKADGMRVYYREGNAYEIKVTNGQVTYFKRNLFDIRENAASGGAEAKPAFDAINVIASEYLSIYDRIAGEEADVYVSDEEKFSRVAASISEMTVGYGRIDGKGELVPCYVLSFEGTNTKALFNLYTGESI